MRFVFYTNSVSPHQLPLAHELVKCLGADEYRYVAMGRLPKCRLDCGWVEEREPWIVYGEYGSNSETTWLLESCDVLLTGVRNMDLIEKRTVAGKTTIYYSERWFKPIVLNIMGVDLVFSGRLRMLSLKYRRMVRRFVEVARRCSSFFVFPIGVHARHDMELIGVPSGRMFTWAYYVSPHDESTLVPDKMRYVTEGLLPSDYPPIKFSCGRRSCPINGALRLLYIGRLLKLKRVDTIIKAVRDITDHLHSNGPNSLGLNVHLLIVGEGPERDSLEKMAAGYPVSFMGTVSIDKVRPLMQLNDVLIFSSDARDGWGAVVSEALEEGMSVIGTYETGASATMLPETNLFHAGDSKALVKIISGQYQNVGIGEWSAAAAAKRLLDIAKLG